MQQTSKTFTKADIILLQIYSFIKSKKYLSISHRIALCFNFMKEFIYRPIVLLLFLVMITQVIGKSKKKSTFEIVDNPQQPSEYYHAYFGGGCFWCVQAMFQDLKGVSEVQSGYMGGYVQNPTYKQVKKGKTGHVQVIKITYNPDIISFKELLYIFMHCHDPTTYHRQGIDGGSQYRSAIFYQNQQELITTKTLLTQIQKDGSYSGYPQPILTEISFAGRFYPAEGYHQDYYSQNPFDQECSSIIAPKLAKMRKLFASYYQQDL